MYACQPQHDKNDNFWCVGHHFQPIAHHHVALFRYLPFTFVHHYKGTEDNRQYGGQIQHFGYEVGHVAVGVDKHGLQKGKFFCDLKLIGWKIITGKSPDVQRLSLLPVHCIFFTLITIIFYIAALGPYFIWETWYNIGLDNHIQITKISIKFSYLR